MKEATKTEMKALYTAIDIYRRAAILADMWISFDPYGAVVYDLHDLVESAFALRETVINSKAFWNYAKEPKHPLRPIKEDKDKYKTFANHIKSIEAAIRRLVRNEWVAKNVKLDNDLKDIRICIADLKTNF